MVFKWSPTLQTKPEYLKEPVSPDVPGAPLKYMGGAPNKTVP